MKKGFLWGGASAAHQMEGAWNEDGKAGCTADYITAGDGRRNIQRKVTYLDASGRKGSSTVFPYEGIPDGAVLTCFDDEFYPSHVASDFYHHYEEDIAMLAETGINCFRMSINWSRIFPHGGTTPNESGLRYYHNVFKTLKKYGIEPVVTLMHFEMPAALVHEYGGFLDRKSVDDFALYAKTVMDRFHDEVKYWMAFNEINNMEIVPLYAGGVRKADDESKAIATYHQFLASAKAVQYAHAHYPDMQVGMMIAYTACYALTAHPADQILQM